jgi:hypothetical protein
MNAFRSRLKSSAHAESSVAGTSSALIDRRRVLCFVSESIQLAWKFFMISAALTAGVFVGFGLLGLIAIWVLGTVVGAL